MKRLLAGLTLVSLCFVFGCEEPKPAAPKSATPAASSGTSAAPAPAAPSKDAK